MSCEQATAAVLAAAVGLIAYDYKRYHFWIYWLRRRAFFGLIPMLVLHAAIGCLAATVGEARNLEPWGSDDWLGNAIVFAAIGQGLARADLRRDRGASDAPASALARAVGWVEGALDFFARKRARGRIGQLSDEDRLQWATGVFYEEIEPDPSLPDAVKAQLGAQINDTAAIIRGAAPGDVDTARAQLNAVLLNQTMSRHLTYE